MARPSKDYTGMQFGYLTVLGRADKRDKRGNILWHCKCSNCGGDCYYIGAKLPTRKSCGCLNEGIDIEDYIGKKINDWFIMETTNKTDKGWNVRCCCLLCNTVKDDVNIYNIISGRSKNCGCGRKETLANVRRKHTVETLKKEKFGRLKVVAEAGRNKYGKIMYKCECDCGRTVTVLGNSLLMGTTRSCGCLRTSWGERMRDIATELGYASTMEKYYKCYYDGIKCFRFDLYIKELNLAIEYDGEGHYIPIDWGGEGEVIARQKFKKALYRDMMKNKFCKENGIHLLRIPYTERDHMKELIINKINEIKNLEK